MGIGFDAVNVGGSGRGIEANQDYICFKFRPLSRVLFSTFLIVKRERTPNDKINREK